MLDLWVLFRVRRVSGCSQLVGHPPKRPRGASLPFHRADQPVMMRRALGDSLRAPGVFFQARGAKSRRMVEVILLEDVAGLGIAGHIVRVKPGR